jgi:hypothetical protein
MKGTPPDAGVPGEDANVVVNHEWRRSCSSAAIRQAKPGLVKSK